MKKITSYLAYFWASLGSLIILVAFIGMSGWQQLSLKLPFMRLDPQYSGGAIIDTVINNNQTIYVHENVFPGVFSQSKTGFIQLDVLGTNIDTIKIDSILINNNLTSIYTTIDKAKADNFEVVNFAKMHDKWIIRLKVEK